MKLRIGTIIAVIALVVALGTLYVVHNIASSKLSCIYYTYINTTCTGHVCTFEIPVEPGKWYKIIDISCRGVGILNIYFTSGSNMTYVLVNSSTISVVLHVNNTVSLPVDKSAKYSIYVRTDVPVGEVSGRLSIVEVS